MSQSDDISVSLDTSLDSLEGIGEGTPLLSTGEQGLFKLLSASSRKSKNNERKRRKRYMTEPRKHQDRLKERTAYARPSREGLVPLMAHVPEELRTAIKERAEQSGVTLNEFLTAIYRKVLQDPAQEQSSASVAEVLKQTTELQKTIRNLALDSALSSRSPSR